jgi:hypothetical protein
VTEPSSDDYVSEDSLISRGALHEELEQKNQAISTLQRENDLLKYEIERLLS